MHFTSRSSTGSHGEFQEKNPLFFQKEEGKRDHFEIRQIIICLTRPPSGEVISPEPNLLGLYQSLTYWGKENTQLQKPPAILSHLKGWNWDALKFTVQRHRFTKRLRPNHRTIDPHILPLALLKSYLPQFFYLWHHVHISTKILQDILKDKKQKTKTKKYKQKNTSVWRNWTNTRIRVRYGKMLELSEQKFFKIMINN